MTTASAASKVTNAESVRIPIADITPSKTNPRKRFDAGYITELSKTIAKHGVLQPILLRPTMKGQDVSGYEIVAGECRWRASKEAGKTDIPATIRQLSDLEVLEIQVIENLQRKDLHPMEEAEGYAALMKCKGENGKPYTAEEIAAKVAKSRSYVYGKMTLLKLCPPVREQFFDGKFPESIALLLSRGGLNADLQQKATKEILTDHGRGPMSVRDASHHLRSHYMLSLDKAPFDTGDAALLKEAPDCKSCPKRSGSNEGLFKDLDSPNVCTDPICYAAKRDAHIVRLSAKAKETGQPVIDGKEAKRIWPDQHSQLKGFTRLDASDVLNGSFQPFRKALGKDIPPVSILVSPYTRELVQVVSTKDLVEALKAKGIKQGGSGTSRAASATPQQKAAKKKAEQEKAVRIAVHMSLRAALASNGLGLEDLREVAAGMWVRLWHEHRKVVAKWWTPDNTGPADKKGKVTRIDRIEALDKRIATMTGPELLTLVADCTYVGTAVGVVNTYGPTKGLDLLTSAKRVGVDIDAVRKTVQAQEAEQPKPGKKPAPKDTGAKGGKAGAK